ncbi:hypothetical protein MMC18_008257 [Xylographa bjoerkii]|nr:hypothetical protein [Xylographa bjoerkii]
MPMGHSALINPIQHGLEIDTFERASTMLSSVVSTIPKVPNNTLHCSSLHNNNFKIESSRDNVHLSQAPLRTPMKATPNSSRRRRAVPQLTRAGPSPSHRVKMASIFKDAAEELRACCVSVPQLSTVLPSFHNSSYSKRSYFPLPTMRTKRNPQGKAAVSPQGLDYLATTSSGAPSPEDVTLPNLRPKMVLSQLPLPLTLKSPSRTGPNDTARMEPPSSGFTSPIGPYVQARNEENAPLIAVYQDSDEDECHSTHGVPYIIAPRVAILTPQQHKPNIDAWLDELMEPAVIPGSQPSTQSANASAQSDTETGHERSSPTPRIITKKMRGFNPSKIVCRPVHTSVIPVQNPLYLGAVSERPSYLDISESPHSSSSPARNTGNKENRAPPTVALSWSSVASSPPREPHCTDDRHIQSSAALVTSSVSDKVDTISHPTFSTPSTLCSPDHRKKLSHITTSSHNTSRKDECHSTADFATRLSSEAGSAGARNLPAEDASDQADAESVEDCDEGAEALPLSPEVERYRKGRGPRRERCTSYWDGDIVPEFSPFGKEAEMQRRQVL